jgi:hypothetical protein
MSEFPRLNGYCERHLTSNRKKKTNLLRTNDAEIRLFVHISRKPSKPVAHRGNAIMLIKITLALAIAIATLASVTSDTAKVTASSGLASGGGNLVPIW